MQVCDSAGIEKNAMDEHLAYHNTMTTLRGGNFAEFLSDSIYDDVDDVNVNKSRDNRSNTIESDASLPIFATFQSGVAAQGGYYGHYKQMTRPALNYSGINTFSNKSNKSVKSNKTKSIDNVLMEIALQKIQSQHEIEIRELKNEFMKKLEKERNDLNIVHEKGSEEIRLELDIVANELRIMKQNYVRVQQDFNVLVLKHESERKNTCSFFGSVSICR